jgi:2-keto-3-deoxy-L-rhamnonate aldolase RhmA
MGFAHGLHVEMKYDLPGMLSSPQIERFYTGVVAACRRAGIKAGAFCLGKERARQVAALGYEWVGFDSDLNAAISYAQGVVQELR